MPKVSTEPIFIGCELVVRKGDEILLGLRSKIKFGAGTWGLPGGHMEHGERAVEAACREAHEELGIHVKPDELKLVSIVDTPPPPGGEHHVHITFELRNPMQQPRIMEPDECDDLRYFPLSSLPENILETHKPIIENYLAGRLYA